MYRMYRNKNCEFPIFDMEKVKFLENDVTLYEKRKLRCLLPNSISPIQNRAQERKWLNTFLKL